MSDAKEQYAVAVARAHVAKCVRNGEDETVVFSDYDSEQNARVSHLLAAYDTLTRERDEARVVTDAMVERAARVILSRHVIATGKNAEKAWLWYGDDFKNEAREYLTAALSEAT